MHPTEVDLSRENLRSRILSLHFKGSPPPPGHRPASVLIPFFFSPEPSILFLKRPETMRDHPGQIAFPGGKTEPGETPEKVALREVSEELGIPPHAIELWGILPPVPSAVTHFWITPVVGELLDTPSPSGVNTAEVEEWFFVSVTLLLNPPRHHGEEILIEDRKEKVDYLFLPGPGGERIIWGATARILRLLFSTLFGGTPSDSSPWYLL